MSMNCWAIQLPFRILVCDVLFISLYLKLMAGEPSNRARLNWRQRLDIIHGVAHGVAYLHQGSEDSVVHRDLKPSNVLLDDNWKPKIADFNTAKLFIEDQPDQSDLTIVVSP
jgi:serine/threonine protein kinase